MRPRLAIVVESLVNVVRRDAGVRQPDPSHEPAPREQAQKPAPQRWKEPLPVMEDRDGHVHVLL
jgi:hypothetical protein